MKEIKANGRTVELRKRGNWEGDFHHPSTSSGQAESQRPQRNQEIQIIQKG
jgi:hypothetical protein